MLADKILINGNIYSVGADDKVTRGQAIAIKEGLITAIGTNEEIAKFKEEGTQVIDCKGNTILPGMCDAHCHPSWMASMLQACQLFDIKGTPEETSRQVIEKYIAKEKEFAEKNTDKKILKGIGWDRAFFNSICRQPEWPSRHDLDRISTEKPIIMESYCQHMMWVNTKALELAGIDENTPDVVNGEIVREPDGYPSGLLFEMEAIDLLKSNIPGYDYTVDEYKETLLTYQEEMLGYGVTLINECKCTENAIRAYKELAEEERLKARFRGVYDYADCNTTEPLAGFAERRENDNVNDLFSINTIKIFLEGEMTMLEPYEKEYNLSKGYSEDFGGKLFYNDETVKKAMKAAAETGMQIHIHAMGDAAVKQAVQSLVYAQNETGTANRNIVAHLMLIRDEDVKAMGENNIIANCQSRWMEFDSDTDVNYGEMYGRERADRTYPNKSFLEAGCVVAYGTDFPVLPPPNPYHNIQVAITRSILPTEEFEYERYKGTVLGPADDKYRECVSLKDAIKSNTWAGAYQNYLEDITGSIEVGKSADLVLLDCNIEEIQTDRIYDIETEMTLFKGNVVFAKS